MAGARKWGRFLLASNSLCDMSSLLDILSSKRLFCCVLCFFCCAGLTKPLWHTVCILWFLGKTLFGGFCLAESLVGLTFCQLYGLKLMAFVLFYVFFNWLQKMSVTCRLGFRKGLLKLSSI